jgi:hypothetical protein
VPSALDSSSDIHYVTATTERGDLLIVAISTNKVDVRRSERLQGVCATPINALLDSKSWIGVHCGERLWAIRERDDGQREPPQLLRGHVIKALPDPRGNVVWTSNFGNNRVEAVDQRGEIVRVVALDPSCELRIPMFVLPDGGIVSMEESARSYVIASEDSSFKRFDVLDNAGMFLDGAGWRIAVHGARESSIAIVDCKTGAAWPAKVSGIPTNRQFSPDGKHLAMSLMEEAEGDDFKHTRVVLLSEDANWEPTEIVSLRDNRRAARLCWSLDATRLFVLFDPYAKELAAMTIRNRTWQSYDCSEPLQMLRSPVSSRLASKLR